MSALDFEMRVQESRRGGRRSQRRGLRRARERRPEEKRAQSRVLLVCEWGPSGLWRRAGTDGDPRRSTGALCQCVCVCGASVGVR